MTTIETAISEKSTAHTVVDSRSEASSGTYVSSTFASMEPNAASTEMQPTTSFIQISSDYINSDSPCHETSLPYEYYHNCSLTITGCQFQARPEPLPVTMVLLTVLPWDQLTVMLIWSCSLP